MAAAPPLRLPTGELREALKVVGLYGGGELDAVRRAYREEETGRSHHVDMAERFLRAFQPIKAGLEVIDERAASMARNASQVAEETRRLDEETRKNVAEYEATRTRQLAIDEERRAAEDFVAKYEITADDATLLLGPGARGKKSPYHHHEGDDGLGDDEYDDDYDDDDDDDDRVATPEFFEALERAKAARDRCAADARDEALPAILELLEDLSATYDQALSRVYEWTAKILGVVFGPGYDDDERALGVRVKAGRDLEDCAAAEQQLQDDDDDNLQDDDDDHGEDRGHHQRRPPLGSAIAALLEREAYARDVVAGVARCRRDVVIMRFRSALSKGGDRAIEVQATSDPYRYVSDVLAFAHQAACAEKEVAEGLFLRRRRQSQSQRSQKNDDSDSNSNSKKRVGSVVDAALEPVAVDIGMRVEALLAPESPAKLDAVASRRLGHLVDFYRGALGVVSASNPLCEALADLATKARARSSRLAASRAEAIADMPLARFVESSSSESDETREKRNNPVGQFRSTLQRHLDGLDASCDVVRAAVAETVTLFAADVDKPTDPRPRPRPRLGGEKNATPPHAKKKNKDFDDDTGDDDPPSALVGPTVAAVVARLREVLGTAPQVRDFASETDFVGAQRERVEKTRAARASFGDALDWTAADACVFVANNARAAATALKAPFPGRDGAAPFASIFDALNLDAVDLLSKHAASDLLRRAKLDVALDLARRATVVNDDPAAFGKPARERLPKDALAASLRAFYSSLFASPTPDFKALTDQRDRDVAKRKNNKRIADAHERLYTFASDPGLANYDDTSFLVHTPRQVRVLLDCDDDDDDE
eukprot:CAMPEP_0118918400 /NCGR_PEP_ID=MMETSP1166-20130328/17895_1 /TAXON_ID=1104430 /ORGANISM="Chrysoreinhardia sp, Strain CCMP3193" /LENGTH=827 /DNA_ID=CAMNT_0006858701 /DNA_START=56 /DNA_END=2539 /DNA_ORIENTATION=-